MSNYIKKAAAHARLLKLASAARLIRRQRALQKYAQAVQMQKYALSTGAMSGIGAGAGALIGGGLGYGLGKKDKKLLSALIGAGAGAGVGGLGGYGLGAYLNRPAKGTDEALSAAAGGKTWADGDSEYDEAVADAQGMLPEERKAYLAYSAQQRAADKEKTRLLGIIKDPLKKQQYDRLVNAINNDQGNLAYTNYDADLLKLVELQNPTLRGKYDKITTQAEGAGNGYLPLGIGFGN